MEIPLESEPHQPQQPQLPMLESLGESLSVSRSRETAPDGGALWELSETIYEGDGHFHFTASGDITREFVSAIGDRITLICTAYTNPTIHIKFRSAGGDTTAALGLVEELKLIRMEADPELGFAPKSRPRIIFIAFDYIASCAMYIFAQGDERYALRGTKFMFHCTQIYRSDGSPDDTEYALEMATKYDLALCRPFALVTRYPLSDWFRLIRTRLDWTFTQTQMFETGLVTKVISW